jgi:hypothetical protein
MREVPRSRAISLVLMVVLAALPWAPRVHVHDVPGADGHDHRVAHSHREAHVHDLDDHHVPAGVALDHEASVVATLDPVFTVPVAHLLEAPAVSLVELIPEPVVARHMARSGFVERLIHGPPRAPDVPRGPPLFSRL